MNDGTQAPMRIVSLTASNIKRLRAVAITPKGPVVEITGRNGQGKSSVLDSIQYAMGGKGSVPAKPIRSGEESAEIVVDLGEIVVKRRWTSSGQTYLSVESHNGVSFKSPQAILDKLASSLTFDPLGFMRLDPKAQLSLLAGLAGINLDEIAGKRKALYDTRTALNRDAEKAKARRDGAPLGDPDATPINVADLADKLSQAHKQIAENRKAREQVEADELRVQSITRRISELENELNEMRGKLSDAMANRLAAEEAAALLVDPDVEAISKELASAEGVNVGIRLAKQRAEFEAEYVRVRDESSRTSEAIRLLDAEVADAIEHVELPVAGLGFGDGMVTLNGLPFDQASSAEQLRVSVAMGLAMNPTLRVLLIRDGSLLDDASLEMVRTMAESADAQVWIERVSEGEPCGVVIEDGEVKQDAQ